MAVTTSLHLTKPTVGGDADVWPTKLNSDLDYIDIGTNQTVTVAMADANKTLISDGTADDQSRYAIYNLTGALTATRTVTLPTNVKIGYVINATTGSHNITLSGGGSTSLTVAPSSCRLRFEVDSSGNVTCPKMGAGNGTTANDLVNVAQFASTAAAGNSSLTFPGGLIMKFGTTVTTLASSGGVLIGAVSYTTAFTTPLTAIVCNGDSAENVRIDVSAANAGGILIVATGSGAIVGSNVRVNWVAFGV